MKIEDENKEIRNFSFIFGFGFIILGTLFFFKKHWSLVPHNTKIIFLIAIIVIIIGLTIPQILKPFYKLWMGFGELLGKINNTILMSILYFLFITPLAIFFRIIKKNLLHKNFDKNIESYWEVKDKDTDITKQY